MTDAACLSAVGLTKTFGPVTALVDVSMSLREGEVTALVGDNGAGKSTLISMLSGTAQPDEGHLEVNGSPVVLESPSRAESFGIATVFQDLALVNQRDVAANLFLGRELCKWGWVLDRRRMIAEAGDLISRLRVNLPNVRTDVGRLSGGQRQAVAIARAVLRGSRVVLLDEPTAALGVRESRRVSEVVVELRATGHAVLLISHNLTNVFELADRIVVLRLGRKVADVSIGETSYEEIVGLIVGGASGGVA